MNNDNDLNLHSMTKLSGWLRYWLEIEYICHKDTLSVTVKFRLVTINSL